MCESGEILGFGTIPETVALSQAHKRDVSNENEKKNDRTHLFVLRSLMFL